MMRGWCPARRPVRGGAAAAAGRRTPPAGPRITVAPRASRGEVRQIAAAVALAEPAVGVDDDPVGHPLRGPGGLGGEPHRQLAHRAPQSAVEPGRLHRARPAEQQRPALRGGQLLDRGAEARQQREAARPAAFGVHREARRRERLHVAQPVRTLTSRRVASSVALSLPCVRSSAMTCRSRSALMPRHSQEYLTQGAGIRSRMRHRPQRAVTTRRRTR